MYLDISKGFQSKFIHPSMTGKALCIAFVGLHLGLDTGFCYGYLFYVRPLKDNSAYFHRKYIF